MSASLAAAVDAAVAAELAAAGTAVASVGAALAAVASWPGQRLVVLGPSAFAGVADLVAIADRSQGAAVLLVDPFIDVNLVIARVGVSVGVLGMETAPRQQAVPSRPRPATYGRYCRRGGRRRRRLLAVGLDRHGRGASGPFRTGRLNCLRGRNVHSLDTRDGQGVVVVRFARPRHHHPAVGGAVRPGSTPAHD